MMSSTLAKPAVKLELHESVSESQAAHHDADILLLVSAAMLIHQSIGLS